jgi:hypothetical protein
MLFSSCSRSYSFQAFSYPPDSQPHENNWTYICKVIDWQQTGKRQVEKGKRKIEIIINDRNKNNVLEDTLEIESASIETKIQWAELEQLTLDLYEVGNEYAEDEYNKQLIKEGPKHLITLNYVWDGKKYIKRGTEQANIDELS